MMSAILTTSLLWEAIYGVGSRPAGPEVALFKVQKIRMDQAKHQKLANESETANQKLAANQKLRTRD